MGGAAPKPPAGHFRVLYFASASSFTARESDDLPAPLAIDRLFDVLEAKYVGMREKILSSCLVTVNLDYVDVPPPSTKGDDDENTSITATTAAASENCVVIKEGDEVAIIPPVSSG